jgi:hypothetical protein
MGFLDDITGQTGADAAQQAAGVQSTAANAAMQFVNDATAQSRADLQPFQQAGAAALPSLTGLATDPNAQKDFITENPFYKALADDAQSRLLGAQASQGKAYSGGTREALQNSLLLLGDDLVGSNVNRQQNLANMGMGAAGNQAAAAQYGGRSISELVTGQANANAAGLVGAANAEGQGSENLLGGALGIGSLLAGDDGLAGIGSSLGSAATSAADFLGLGGEAGPALGGGVPGSSVTTTGLGADAAGGFSSNPLSSLPSPTNLIGGASQLPGVFGLAAGAGSTAPTVGAGALTSLGNTGALAAGTLDPALVSSLTSLGNPATVGAAAGGAPTTGALGGAGGAALGAAIPLGVAAFGKFQMDKKRAEKTARFAPILASMKAGPVTTVNSVQGRQFSHNGQNFLAPMRVDDIPDGEERALYDVYNVQSGEWGAMTSEGFSSDLQIAERQAKGNEGQDAVNTPDQVRQMGSTAIGRPIYNDGAGFGLTNLPPDQYSEFLRNGAAQEENDVFSGD